MSKISYIVSLPLLVIVCDCGIAVGQSTGTFHLFPMVILGERADGGEWDGSFGATNVDGRLTTCMIETFDMPSFSGQATFTLPRLGSIEVLNTDVSGKPVNVGYATISCDRDVSGAFVRSLDAGGPTPALEFNTILPAVRSSLASLPVYANEEFGARVIVAIVNDDDVTADFDVSVLNLEDELVGSTRVTIPPKSQFIAPSPTLVPVPFDEEGEFFGSMQISSVEVLGGESGAGLGRRGVAGAVAPLAARFYAMGMLREGTETTMLPATQLAP